ncbi:MAG: hypothetical protein R3F65_31635 [bacterium]
MTALLLLLGLLAPADVSAGRIYLPALGATQGTAPRPMRIAAVHVGSGFCPDIAILSLRLPGKWALAYGYHLAVAAGRPPPGVETGEHLYSAPNGIVRLAWIDPSIRSMRSLRNPAEQTVQSRGAARSASRSHAQTGIAGSPSSPPCPPGHDIPP